MNPAPAPLPGLATDAELAAGLRVVRCRECHQPLVDRDARLLELGAACALKRGLRVAPGPGRFPAAQETLPGV